MVHHRGSDLAHVGGCGGGMCPKGLTPTAIMIIVKKTDEISLNTIGGCQFSESCIYISIVIANCSWQDRDDQFSSFIPASLDSRFRHAVVIRFRHAVVIKSRRKIELIKGMQ